MPTHLERAARRLLADDACQAAFRADPEAFARRHGLGPAELAALQRGDAAELAALNVRVDRLLAEPVRPSWAVWLNCPAGRLATAVLAGAALALGGALAAPGRARAARRAIPGRARGVRAGLRARVRARRASCRLRAAKGMRMGRCLRAGVRALGKRAVAPPFQGERGQLVDLSE